MSRLNAFAALFVTVCFVTPGRLHADTKVSLPSSPAPVFTVARLNEKGLLEVRRKVTGFVPVKEAVTVIKNGEKVVKTVTRQVPVIRQVTTVFRLNAVTVYRGANEKLTGEDLRDELDRPQAAVMSADGKKIDPFYYRLLKSNVLTIERKQIRRKAVNKPGR